MKDIDEIKNVLHSSEINEIELTIYYSKFVISYLITNLSYMLKLHIRPKLFENLFSYFLVNGNLSELKFILVVGIIMYRTLTAYNNSEIFHIVLYCN